ncbi:MAG: RNA-binding protein, partial [Parvularculaceae bacterium]|nr:RNA-binding protein [Parvularculaceae bacterium]
AGGGPERTCIAGGGATSADAMVRFALGPDGEVAPDFSGKLPGRGAWVSANRAALTTAIKKNLFARAFRAHAVAPAELPAAVEAGLKRRALDAIGLARRAGQAAAGYDQVRDCLAGGAMVLITASDAAEDGASKLKRAAGQAEVFRLFTVAELSAALGRDGVRHVALKRGPAAKRFTAEARRLAGFVAGANEDRAQGA